MSPGGATSSGRPGRPPRAAGAERARPRRPGPHRRHLAREPAASRRLRLAPAALPGRARCSRRGSSRPAGGRTTATSAARTGGCAPRAACSTCATTASPGRGRSSRRSTERGRHELRPPAHAHELLVRRRRLPHRRAGRRAPPAWACRPWPSPTTRASTAPCASTRPARPPASSPSSASSSPSSRPSGPRSRPGRPAPMPAAGRRAAGPAGRRRGRRRGQLRAQAGRGSRGLIRGRRRRPEGAERPPEALPGRSARRPRRPSPPTATSGTSRAAATVPPAAARAAGAGGHHLVLLARDYAGLEQPLPHHQRRPPGAPGRAARGPARHPGRAQRPPRRAQRLPPRRGLVAAARRRRGRAPARRPPCFRDIFGRELLHRAAARAAARLGRVAARPRPAGPRAAPAHGGHQRRALHGQGRRRRCTTCSPPRPPTSRCPTRWGARTPSSTSRARRRCAASSSATREAYANAARIAARCNLDLGLGRLLFPAYPLPPGETAFSLLWKRCFAGAAERYTPLTAEVTARLERELKVVQELGFAEYFLAVHDIVEFARGRGIYYSGRGSAGNSIVSYVLRVTDADPIAHELLFERFLNPARREMPDVDIDFCSARRDEVIQYIYERFGHDKVAMVATVNTVRAPSAVRIVSRAFGFTPDEINAPLQTRAVGQRRQARGDARRAPRARRPRVPAPALPPPRARRRAPLRLPRPPRHAPRRLHPLARPAHRPRAAAVGRQGRRGGPVRQGRRRDAGPRQDGHPRPQDALRHRRGRAPHRGAHRRARQRLGAAARRPQGLRAHQVGAHRRACSSSRARGSATWPRACRSATSKTSSPPSRCSARGRCRPT